METKEQQLGRKERERQFKREEIVAAARLIFAKQGFNSATLDEIADEAEYSKGTLYNYFDSKEELFETVIADVVDEFVEIATEHCTNAERGLKDSYLGFARDLMHHLFANVGIYSLVMREFHKMEANTHLATLMPNLIMIMAEPLERAIRNGEVEALPAEQTAMMFITMIFSLFKSTLHIEHAHVFNSEKRQVSLASSQVDGEIENALCVLERTFFTGIFARPSDHQDGWCFQI